MAASLDAHLARKSSGVHLRLVSSPASEPVGCEAVLQTAGHFVDVSELRLDAGDRVELAADGRTLRLRNRLENRARASADGERLIPDEDGVVFRISPPNAPIELQRLRLADGRALPLQAWTTVPKAIESRR